MSRKKIKADNVEQLLEIVKAIQNGEEPDEALRKKNMEGAPEADSPNPYSEEEEYGGHSEKKAVKKRAGIKKNTEKGSEKERKDRDVPEDDFSDDEFDKILEEDEELDFRPALNRISEGAGRLFGALKGLGGRLRPEADGGKKRDFDPEAARDAGKTEEVSEKASEKARVDAGNTVRTVSEKQADMAAEDELDQLAADIGIDDMEDDSQEAAGAAILDKLLSSPGRAASKAGQAASEPGRAASKAGQAASEPERDASGAERAASEPRQAAPESGQDVSEIGRGASEPGWAASKTRQAVPETGRAASESGQAEAPADEENDMRKASGGVLSGRKKKAADDSENSKKDKPQSLGRKLGKLSAQKNKTVKPRRFELAEKVKVSFSDLKEKLESKGIRRRELIMLGMGAVLVVLIIVLIAGGLSASHQEKVKSENVTAEEGLTVTVEQQPEQWTSSYPVVLRFRAQGQTIQKVTINGEDYVPDENAHIVVTTSDYLLEAAATTEQGTLNARIEIPMIDSQPPVVNVVREKEQITVTAADARSTVTKIYYAAVHAGDYIQLPEYQLYSEPLTFETDTTYYFYAVDKAGNRSVPIVTTTEDADEMTLDRDELSLFPEETGYLAVKATPDNALLNNLRYESANEDVVTVTGTGEVTAVGQGSTVIKVSADGVEDVSCPVTVSEARTVTVSAIGDCTLGTDESFNTDTSFDAFDAVYGHEYFFKNVKAVLENDDATFANLEGPLTTSDTKTTVEQFAFKGDPSYTAVLESGSVEVVTLANNHINDYGSQGLEDTKQALAQAGIDYCIDDEIVLRDVNGIKTAFIGIYELNEGIQCESRVRETIADAKARGAQLVIVAFHWGSERSNEPDEVQQSLAHTAVDCGADLVVGHHPHVLQGIEKYNGKYIAYSLGNFCFGGNSAPSDTDTIIFRQTFSVTRDSVVTDDSVEIIPCSVSSAEGYNNYQPTPATDTEADRIIQRLNEYSSSFGQTFTASDGLGEPAASDESGDL